MVDRFNGKPDDALQFGKGSDRLAPNSAITPLPAVSASRLSLQMGGVSEQGWYSKNGALVRRQQEDGADKPAFGQVTAIQQAFMDHVKAGRLDRVEDLLEVQRDQIDLDFQDEWKGQTPLMLATLGGHLEIVEVLLEARADPHIRERSEMAYTPMEAAQVIMEDEDPDFEELVHVLREASGYDCLPSKRTDAGYSFRR
eukprot:TRINITY_DN86028_c0_g1_i1.p1 TRINITY_DN86028_c0_g1~~TRINITY_DN86028_c0_g1_i1.p1  ORF type:complete len:221 (-),score=47.98 TRINITY_DN86028_c0_g1_i1:34-627(-)